MRSLSNLDASFLNLETPRTPMHLAGSFIFRDRPDQRMTATRFRQHIRARVKIHRILRERLILSPLGLGQAWWAEDPEFDLEDHLHFNECDGPLTQASLAPITDAFLQPLLNRNAPLWEVMFVSERDTATAHDIDKSSRFAVLLKVHHAACDGLSAKHLITSLFDGFLPHNEASAADNEVAPDNATDTGERHTIPPLPSPLTLLINNVHAARQTGHQLRNLTTHLIHCLKQSVALRLQGAHKQPLFYNVAPSPFNIAIDARRVRLNVELALPLLKAIRQTQPDVTINDIVLTICGAALRRYMKSAGINPENAAPSPQSLTAFAPVSKREEGQHSDGGNQVSGMLIGLCTDIDDPLGRLRAVRANALRAKQFNAVTAYEKLLDYVPGAAASLFLSAYAKKHLGNVLPPIFNLVVTNIASLPPTLNLSGAPLESVATFAPIHDAMALSIVVLTHKNTTYLGITSTPEAIADPALFASCLLQAQDELVSATKMAGREPLPILAPAMRSATPDRHAVTKEKLEQKTA